MSAGPRGAFEQDLARVEALIGALEQLPDPAAREPARELLQVVLNLHAAGLEALLALVRETADGAALLARMTAEPRVRGLLLLHGLHPDDLPTRVRSALEGMCQRLAVHGLSAETTMIDEAAVRVKVSGDVVSKLAIARTLRRELEEAVLEAAPDIGEVSVDGLHDYDAVFRRASAAPGRSVGSVAAQAGD